MTRAYELQRAPSRLFNLIWRLNNMMTTPYNGQEMRQIRGLERREINRWWSQKKKEINQPTDHEMELDKKPAGLRYLIHESTSNLSQINLNWLRRSYYYFSYVIFQLACMIRSWSCMRFNLSNYSSTHRRFHLVVGTLPIRLCCQALAAKTSAPSMADRWLVYFQAC